MYRRNWEWGKIFLCARHELVWARLFLCSFCVVLVDNGGFRHSSHHSHAIELCMDRNTGSATIHRSQSGEQGEHLNLAFWTLGHFSAANFCSFMQRATVSTLQGPGYTHVCRTPAWLFNETPSEDRQFMVLQMAWGMNSFVVCRSQTTNQKAWTSVSLSLKGI